MIPAALENKDYLIVRDYDSNERIIYGTGRVVPREAIIEYAGELFNEPRIEFLHVRSTTNNCWQAGMVRAS